MAVITPPIKDMSTAFSVKGMNVVVTGGNRGIGFGISTAFAQSGANVAVLCRNAAKAQEAVEGFKQYGGKYIGIACDISDLASVKAAKAEIDKFFDHVDVLVNNAGVATVTPFLDEDKGLSEWHRVIDTDLHGVAHMIHEVAPSMEKAGKGGTIINITSVGGQRVSGSLDHHNAPYNVSKAGVDIFTRYLAIVLGESGIRVNAIAPGPIHSDLDKDLPASFIEQISKELPAHRFGEPIEIGALCVYLASPAARQITGVCYALDGGLLCIN